MSTLEGRLKDPAYKHWVKTGLCLALVKEGLEEYAEIKSKEFHDVVLASVAKIQTYQTAICDNERITFDNNNNGKIACNHAFCQGFLNEVVNLGIDPTMKFTIRKANIENCDVKLWPTDHWELAKLFMNQGQKACQTNPSQTDLSGVLNFLEHCKVPRNGVQNAQHIDEVRQTRNSVMHTSDMKVSPGMFQTYTQTMLDLLRNPNLAKLSSAKTAESEIQKVIQADFQILLEDEITVIKNRMTALEKVINDTKTEIRELRKEFSSMQQTGDEEKKILQTKIQQMEEETNKIADSLAALTKRVSDDKTLQEKIGLEVKNLHGALEQAKKDLWNAHNELKRQVENIEQKIRDAAQERKVLSASISALSDGQGELKRRQEDMEERMPLYNRQTKMQSQIEAIKPAAVGDEEKAQLQQYLKEGYDENKLSVPILGSCHGVPISEIFAPVILMDTASGQEQEGGQSRDVRLSKYSITEDRRTRASQKLRSYKGIFTKENILKKKIFLLGKAGAGKSTFCKHLADVWSNDEVSPQFDEAEFLKKFRYLFSVSCRFAEASESIFDMICNQLFFENDEMIKVAAHVLKNIPDECLVVVDGIDEWKGSAREETGRRGDIPGLPSRKGLEDCVVLSTSRPERIHMLPVKLYKTCSVLELHGIENAGQLIYSILVKTEYANPRQSCSKFYSQINRSNMTDLIQFPLMLINALSIWDMNETLSNSMCVNYSNMLEGLFLRARDANRIEAHQQDQEQENPPELPDCFRDTNLCKCNSGLIIRLGQLAFDLLFNGDQNLSLIFSGQQIRKYLTANDLKISLAVGILSKAQTSSRSRRRVDNFSFCHKTFQECLGALWLSREESKIMSMFTQQLRSVDTVLENKVFIELFCGLSPSAGEKLWKYIADEVIEKDENFFYFRWNDLLVSRFKAPALQRLVLQCMKEARSSCGEQHRQLYYFFPGIYIDINTNEMDLNLIYSSMEKYMADIKSVFMFDKISSYIIKNMKKMKSAIAVVLRGVHDDCPVLQFPDQLKNLQIKSVDLTACTLEFPLHLVTLAFVDLDMSHSVLSKLISYIKVSSDLHNLCLEGLHCSDHGDISCVPTLYLQRLQSYVELTLDTLPVEIVRLPSQETMPIQLRDLHIASIKMSHSDIEQLCSCLRVSSKLEFFWLTELRCSDHGDNNCCFPSLDLQNHHSLKDVELWTLSVDSVLLPGQLKQHNTSDFYGRLSMSIMMVSVNMSSQSWKRFLDSLLPHQSNKLAVSLWGCNIDNDTKSYIRSCPYFTVTVDDHSVFNFNTKQGQ